MKVFISWSGDASRKIASALNDWLPMVVQSVQPYMSSESIEKGTRWAASIASELEGTNVGIIVMTPENTDSRWIHFEAGALSKVVGEARLAPLLCGLKPSDIGAPLSQFQVTQFTQEDVLKLLKSINGAGEEDGLPEGRLEKMLDALWSDLQQKVQPIIDGMGSHRAVAKKPEDHASEILEEILTLVRQQASVSMTPDRMVRDTVRFMLMELGESGSASDNRRMWMVVKALRSRWTQHKEQLASALAQEGADHSLGTSIERVEVVINDLVGLANPKNRRNIFMHESWRNAAAHHRPNALLDILEGDDAQPSPGPDKG